MVNNLAFKENYEEKVFYKATAASQGLSVVEEARNLGAHGRRRALHSLGFRLI